MVKKIAQVLVVKKIALGTGGKKDSTAQKKEPVSAKKESTTAKGTVIC